MARKQARPSGFILFDVVYEDGTQTSNRKVPAIELCGLDGDGPARTIIESQDQEIAKMAGSHEPASNRSADRAMRPRTRLLKRLSDNQLVTVRAS